MSACWIEIDLAALRHNYHAIQALVGPDVALIAVVKANAYGHGAVAVARMLAGEGVPYLAVTRVEEALPLREAGVTTPILLLTPALPDEAAAVVANRLTACLSTVEDAERLSAAATRTGQTVAAHLKINTGMGRLGVEPEDAVAVAQSVARLPSLRLEGAFTHFARATDQDIAPAHQQFVKFQTLMPKLSAASIRVFHCANSAALVRFPAMRLSCARPGTILYGQFPSAAVEEAATRQGLVLKNGFTVKARVVAVRSLRAGQTLGYGGEWHAPRLSRIATLAVGYADGLAQEPQTRQEPPLKLLQNALRQCAKSVKGHAGAARTVTIRGQRAPIVGRIAMQTCSVDITGLDGVTAGDEATVFMRRTSAGAHLPRVYLER